MGQPFCSWTLMRSGGDIRSKSVIQSLTEEMLVIPEIWVKWHRLLLRPLDIREISNEDTEEDNYINDIDDMIKHR